MFEVNNDLSIHITRGDIGLLSVTADSGNAAYVFAKGDIVRFKVYEKKGCDCVVLMKDFTVEEETEKVDILLTGDDTRIGELIHKPKDYWYEVELNPDTNPQTIIGYDDNGAKVFRLYPEGKEIEDIEEDDLPFVDELRAEMEGIRTEASAAADISKEKATETANNAAITAENTEIAKGKATEAANSALSAGQYKQSAASAAQIATEAADAAGLAKDNTLLAKESALKARDDAEAAAEKAEQAILANGFAEFYIDENGHLYLLRTPNIADTLDFVLTNGRLEVLINE